MSFTPYIEAEFEDGFTVNDLEDVSPFDENANVFDDLLHRRYEAEHGRMARFALVTPELTYTVDWTVLPLNARPIRFKHMHRKFLLSTGQPLEDVQITQIDFGYQYFDEHSEQSIKEVREIKLKMDA